MSHTMFVQIGRRLPRTPDEMAWAADLFVGEPIPYGEHRAVDTIEALRTFVRVIETGSLTAVAREMNTSQSTISRYINQLEEHFGVRLLQRTTRHLSLTDDGVRLRSHATSILQSVEGMEHALGQHKSSPTGHVRIASPVSMGMQLMKCIPVLLERYPGLTVELVLQDRLGDLVEERLDLAIAVGEVPGLSLIKRGLGSVTRIAVAAPEYLQRRGWPRQPEDLANHACIVRRMTPDDAEWRLTGPEGTTDIAVRGLVSTNNHEAVRNATLNSLGIALLPEYLVADDLLVRPALDGICAPELPARVVDQGVVGEGRD